MGANDIRNIVLALRAEGYAMLPSGGGAEGKSPLVPWSAYQKGLPSEAETRTWMRLRNPVLWGIVTGERSSVVIVDCDPGADLTIMDGLEPHVETPRGGSHYWFEHPGEPVKTCAGILPKIDIRGDGGFANVVGVNPKTGGKYIIKIMPARDKLYSWDRMPKLILEAMEKGRQPEAKPDEPGELIPKGKRNEWLFSRACGYRAKGDSEEAIFQKVKIDYEQRCVHDPPMDDKELRASCHSAAKYDPKTGSPEELRRLDEIETREVEWLWNPYIPLGKLTLLEGDPGEGKSWISLAIATRITLEDLGGPANVLIASAEDDFDDTIRPRLEELGANLGLVYAIEEAFTLGSKKGLNDDAFDLLEKHLREKEPSLVIIDPLTAYLGSGVDMHRQNETRPVMARLASLAREYNCAILLIRHINKGGSAKPIYRGMGSIDFTASARSVLLAGHVDREDGSMERALVHIKSNLAPLGSPIGFILGHPFQWTDSTLTANEILNQPIGGGKKTDEAVALIRDLLAGNEAVPANEIFAAAKEAGISQRTMKAAKKILHVKSGKKDKEWHWYLPKGKELPPDIEPIATVKDGRLSVNLDAI
jgi:DNA repair protein RadA/Sms